jgi:hypothetical protein
MSEDMYKPGYDGERLSSRLTGPEAAHLRERKPALIKRLHDAMLTLSVMGGRAELGIVGGAPAHIVEFGDMVGREREETPPAKFKPTAPQVSDMVPALGLLEGLRPAFFKVVMLRALDEFARENGGAGDWPWSKIGGFLGMSDRWAESAYSAAIVQAARRAGILPLVSQDYAILIVGVLVREGYLTNITSSVDPRQEASNLRGKSPVRLETAMAIWTAGRPLAKRIIDETKPALRSLLSHASWYKAHPESVATAIIEQARLIEAPWHMEDLDVVRLRAA